MEFQGVQPRFKVVSQKAHNELSDLIPEKIDRSKDIHGFGKTCMTAFAQIQTTQNHTKRKKAFMKLLSLNSSSRYIPDIISCLDKISGEWKEGDILEFSKQMNYFTFTAFNQILFGKDLEYISSHKVDYINHSNNTVKLEFREFFICMAKDLAYSWVHPLTLILPILNEFDLVNPFKRNLKNIDTFRATLKEFTAKCEDQDSIFFQLRENSDNKEDEIFEDLIFFMLGGTETSSHAITSAIFYLKKNASVLEKLLGELEKNGFTRSVQKVENYTIDNIHKLDYLSYVVKESLRIDNPTTDSLKYEAKENVTICGVPISKGSKIGIDILPSHYNPNEWQCPQEFIPERFDPESEYYKKPETDKNLKEGKSKSRAFMSVPFSYGERKCPGQTFALLEIRVALIFLLTRFDFGISDEILQKEGNGYAIGTEVDLSVMVNKIFSMA